MKNKDRISFLLASIFLLFSFFWLCKAFFLGYYPDFSTQYHVPALILSNANPYLGESSLYTPQAYPPTVFFLYLPVTLLPISTASYFFVGLSLSCLVGSLLLLARIFEIKFLSPINLLLMGLAFAMFPTKFTLGMGQINMIILFLLTLGLWFLKQKREVVAGFIIGVSLSIKLFPILLPFYFLVKLNRKFLFGILLSMLSFLIAVLVFIPWEITEYFIKETVPSLISGWKLDYYNQSLGGFVGRSFGVGTLGSFIKALLTSIIILITFAVVVRNKNKNFSSLSLVIGLLICTSLIVNSFSWQHHFVWLIIPFYAVFSYLRNTKTRWFLYYLLGLSYFLVSVNMEFPSAFYLLYQSHVLYGALVIWGLGIYLLSKKTF